MVTCDNSHMMWWDVWSCYRDGAFFWDVAPCRSRLTFQGWWWKHYVPLKRRRTSTRLHGTISQKGVIFILYAVRTWILTKVIRFYCAEVLQSLICHRSGVSQEPGSSGSIVSDYGLDDRAIEVRSPAGAKDFSSNLCVQTGSGVQPASCTMGTGGPFPGGKSAAGSWRWPLTPI
jgi:hypothetical protein